MTIWECRQRWTLLLVLRSRGELTRHTLRGSQTWFLAVSATRSSFRYRSPSTKIERSGGRPFAVQTGVFWQAIVQNAGLSVKLCSTNYNLKQTVNF
jgi:hypothetical protein